MQWSTNCKVFKDSGLEVWVQFELRPWIATLVRYFYSMISSQMFYGLVFKSQRNLQSPFFYGLRTQMAFFGIPDLYWENQSFLLCWFSMNHQFAGLNMLINHWILRYLTPCFQTNLTALQVRLISTMFFFCCQALFDRAGMNVQAPGSSV